MLDHVEVVTLVSRRRDKGDQDLFMKGFTGEEEKEPDLVVVLGLA